jgi:outer membrane murein-binding lipoprotein Lpp
MKSKFFVLIVMAAAVLFAGCSKLPQAEIDAAKTSLEQAKTAQADIYLVDEFFGIQDSLNVIIVAAEAEKSKMFGNYKEVKAKLEVVTAQSTELVAKTETRKEEIKNDLATAQLEISTLQQENNQLLEIAPKGKEGKEALDAIRADIEGINTSVSDVPGLIESGDLLNAQTKVKAAQEKAAAINTELKTVLEKYMKKS